MQPLRPSSHATLALASAAVLVLSAGATAQGLPDTVSCEGQILVLEAAPGYEEYRWTPREGIVSSVGPRVAFDVERETTYALAAERRTGSNLIADGEFEGDVAAFATDLSGAAGASFGTNTYAIVARAGELAGEHADCPALGATPTDRMLAVHLPAGAGGRVWCRRLPVRPGERYRVDYSVGNLLPEASRPIRITVDGQAVGPERAAEPIDCVWRGYAGTWAGGTATSAEVCIEVTSGPRPTKLGFDRLAVYQLDEVYRDTLTITPLPAPEPIEVTERVCRGSRYRGRGLDLAPGSRGQARFPGPGGCDSVVTVDVVGVDSIVIDRSITGLCGGEAFAHPATGLPLLSDTTFRVTFTSASGCDSTERIRLEFFDETDVTVEVTDPVCGGSTGAAQVAVAAPFSQEAEVVWSDGARAFERPALPANSTTDFTVVAGDGCRIEGSAIVGSSEQFSMMGLRTEPSRCPEPPTGTVAIDATGGAAIASVLRLDDDQTFEPGRLPGGRYEVVAEDYRGCRDTARFELEEAVGLEVSLTGDTLAAFGAPVRHEVVANGTADVSSVTWQFEGENLASGAARAIDWFPSRSGDLEVVVTDGRDCRYTRRLAISRQGRGARFFPNAFSPDGNERNDAFGPAPHPGIEALLELRIIDRWGTTVWLAPQPWDGAGAAGGTYLYGAKLLLRDGQVIERGGEVTLVR